MQLPDADPPCMQTPLDADPQGTDALDADSPGHVACDVCWEANPHVDRQTPVETFPYPKFVC